MDQDGVMAFLNCTVGLQLSIEYSRFHFNDCEMEVMDLQVLLSDCMESQKTSLPSVCV